MHVMLEFQSASGEPLIMPVGGVLDQQRLPPFGNDKDRLEDLQIWSVLKELACYAGTRHPLAVRPGNDPPDRILVHEERTWPTELTELTLENIRGDLAPVRKFGRQLQQRLRERPHQFQHLSGRTVLLAKHTDEKLPRDTNKMLDELEEALADDKGFTGEDVGCGPELMRGSYGHHGPFSVTVNQTSKSGDVIVSATTSLPLSRSEVITVFQDRIATKDKITGNELLIVTCGLPDKQGYVCPFDHAIFLLLQNSIANGIDIMPGPLTNIRGGLVHLWDTDRFFAWGDGTDFPWGNSGMQVVIPDAD
jgi:hypothetical protein